MPRKTNAVAVLVTSVLPMQDIVKLSIKEACQHFADRATISQRAFAEMGKLHFAISAHLKKGQTIYGELRKLGVKDSTISNASYAARVWGDLIAKGHLAEKDYDAFTFADCLSICRVTGDKSKRKLTGEEVTVIVRAHPEDFDAQFDSLHSTGLTVEEAEAQAKAAQEQAAAAEAARKAAEAKAADDKAKAAQEAAVAAALEAERRKQQEASDAAAAVAAAEKEQAGQTPSAAPEPSAEKIPEEVPSAVVTPVIEPVIETPAIKAPAAPTLTVLPPAEKPEVPAQVAHVAPSAPSNVLQMPDAVEEPDAQLPGVLEELDRVLAAVDGMSHSARAEVFAKLNEMMGQLGERLTTEVSAAA
jgi:hypothetical protein